ncbi:MAG: transposase [Burkholderiales bacterium]
MGKRKRQRATELWVPTTDLPVAPSHPFYRRLNELLRAGDFDAFVERSCERFYAARMGRPGLPPGVYFRLLLLGYFEGLDSERGIAWRAADSLALRDFLGLALHEAPPDHSTISRTRRLIDLETHQAVFVWVLEALAAAKLLKGTTLGLDGTTLEANAALRSIVRRDTGEGYQEFLTTLAKASGIGTPTRADLARIDRKRKKKGSNDDWTHPHDPDAKITKMKDGRTHLAHKAEHAVDLDTGAVVANPVQDADDGDTTTLQATLIAAAEHLEAVLPAADVLRELVTDKGFHSNDRLVDLAAIGVRSYISEPDRGRRCWRNKADARAAVYANRRRIRGPRGVRLLRRRGEYLERTFAHTYETGGMRRTHLRGHENILKRLLVHVGGFNLGLLMRTLIGVGTPRGLQGRLAAVLATLWALVKAADCHTVATHVRRHLRRVIVADFIAAVLSLRNETCTTGC